MVNKNETKTKEELRSLTIYPFSIDELKEPQLFSNVKNDKCEIKAIEIQADKRLEQNIQNENLLTKNQPEIETKVTHWILFIYKIFDFCLCLF